MNSNLLSVFNDLDKENNINYKPSSYKHKSQRVKGSLQTPRYRNVSKHPPIPQYQENNGNLPLTPIKTTNKLDRKSRLTSSDKHFSVQYTSSPVADIDFDFFDTVSPKKRSPSFIIEESPSKRRQPARGHSRTVSDLTFNFPSENSKFPLPLNESKRKLKLEKLFSEPKEPSTMDRHLAYVIFGQDNEKIMESFSLAYLHFSLEPIEKFNMIVDFFDNPPCRFKSKTHIESQKMRVVKYFSKWMNISFQTDFEQIDSNKKKSHLVPIQSYIQFITKIYEEFPDVNRRGIDFPIINNLNNSFAQNNNKRTHKRKRSASFGQIPTDIIDINAFVNQLTLHELKLFKNIPLTELIDQAWNKVDKEIRAPRLTNMIKHFNRISQWVTSEITKHYNPKDQAKAIEKYITIAKKLRKIGNFNGLMEIISGLSSINVQRLQSAWKLVSDKYISKLKKLEALMSPFQNFGEYRQSLKLAKTIAIPYTGVHLGDIVHIMEGYVDDCAGLIDFEKVIKLGEVLVYWKSLQNQTFDIEGDITFTHFIHGLRENSLDNEQQS